MVKGKGSGRLRNQKAGDGREERRKKLHFKLKKDPDFLRDYDRIIREPEQAGIVQKVPVEETTSHVDKEQVYY